MEGTTSIFRVQVCLFRNRQITPGVRLGRRRGDGTGPLPVGRAGLDIEPCVSTLRMEASRCFRKPVSAHATIPRSLHNCRREPPDKPARLARLRSLSFSLVGIDCSKSCAGRCLGLLGLSLVYLVDPCPPFGVAQWAGRPHVRATRRGITGNCHSPHTESAGRARQSVASPSRCGQC
jgi:hypothetical protein